jgi:PAS domain S-box-containing protein
MRLINYIYKDIDELKSFIVDNGIENNSSLLMQIFSSNTDDKTVLKVKQELLTLLPKSSIIGTTTAGIVADGKIIDSEIVIAFSIFEHSVTKSHSYFECNIDEIAEDLFNYISSKTKLLICFTNAFTVDAEALIKKITALHPKVVIVGGNSADDFRYEKCNVFSNTNKKSDVAFAIIDSDILRVESKYLLNWRTVGKEFKVTKSEGARVYELNHQKILDFFEYYLGKEISTNILNRGTDFPLIYVKDGVEVARAPIAVHEDGSLTFAGDLLEGTTVKFGYADIEYIEEYNQEKLLQEHVYENEAVYVYSCAARRSMLGEYINDEMEVLNKIAVASGFITYGEFFHNATSCSNDLLNITTTYVILNENQNNSKLIYKGKVVPKRKDVRDITLRTLTNLVSRTSQELDENIYYLEQYKHAVDEVAIFSAMDKDGIITDVNKNFEKISGYSKDELIGQHNSIVKHEHMSKNILNEMWDTIKSSQIWKGIIKHKNKNNKDYYLLSEIGPIYNKDGSFREYIAIRNDITELEEYKQILKHELDTTSHNLEENLNYTSQYEEAINSTTAILKTDIDNVITYANEKFCELSGYTQDELIGKKYFELRHLKHKHSKVCDLIKDKLYKGEIVEEILTNISKDGKEFTVNNLAYPIVNIKGDVIEHLHVMHDLTEIIELNEEIVNTQKEVVYTMGAIGETRSKETGLHVKRVAEYSYLLAKLVGMNEDEASLLKQASPMHDIGKVAIPDNILGKPSELTLEEFEIMKKHAEIGHEMLKHSSKEILQASAIVAYSHHEKWDGSGYPNGIKGYAIHIYGRITAIADVFDALGHDRVYKKAWDLDAILELFKEERGKHFDPSLVDLFFENLDKFLEIRDKMKDT